MLDFDLNICCSIVLGQLIVRYSKLIGDRPFKFDVSVIRNKQINKSKPTMHERRLQSQCPIRAFSVPFRQNRKAATHPSVTANYRQVAFVVLTSVLSSTLFA